MTTQESIKTKVIGRLSETVESLKNQIKIMEYENKRMADHLVKTRILTRPQISDICNGANDIINQADAFYVRWHIEDIKKQAMKLGHDLSQDDCKEIATNIVLKRDDNIGITWEVLDVAIEYFMENK